MPQYEINDAKNRHEEEFFYDFIENDLKTLTIGKEKELQRKKFNLINLLYKELYSNKNSRAYFNFISNKLILLLTSTNKNNVFDNFDDNVNHLGDASKSLKEILKNEL